MMRQDHQGTETSRGGGEVKIRGIVRPIQFGTGTSRTGRSEEGKRKVIFWAGSIQGRRDGGRQGKIWGRDKWWGGGGYERERLKKAILSRGKQGRES